MRKENAYTCALEVLEERYGNSFVISQAFRNKLDSWENVKSRDSVALRSFSDFMKQCLVASQEFGGLDILDDVQYIRRLISKLPEWLVNRWNREVASTKKTCRRYPSFAELAEFVRGEAEIVNDPVFGSASYQTLDYQFPAHDRPPRPRSLSTKRILATNIEEAISCCFCAREDHDLNQCLSFRRKSEKEKSQFVREKKLCYGCLKGPGHYSKSCPKRETCSICTKKHPTSLHSETSSFRRQDQENEAGNAKQKNEASTNTQSPLSPIDEDNGSSVSAQAEESVKRALKTNIHNCRSHTSTVYPVYLSTAADPSHEILIYALVDSMSNGTFVLESCAEELNAKSQQTYLKVDTLLDKETMIRSTKYTELRIRAINSQEYVSLPPAFSREALSFDPDDIPTREMAAQHPHLQHLYADMHPLFANCEPSVLIGYDCPKLHFPLETVPGDPHAVRTVLGWAMMGHTRCTLASDDNRDFDQMIHQFDDSLSIHTVHLRSSHNREVSTRIGLDVFKGVDMEIESRSCNQDSLAPVGVKMVFARHKSTGHFEQTPSSSLDKPTLQDLKAVLWFAMLLVSLFMMNGIRKLPYHRSFNHMFISIVGLLSSLIAFMRLVWIEMGCKRHQLSRMWLNKPLWIVESCWFSVFVHAVVGIVLFVCKSFKHKYWRDKKNLDWSVKVELNKKASTATRKGRDDKEMKMTVHPRACYNVNFLQVTELNHNLQHKQRRFTST